jgi:hypothetical protein
MPSTDFLENPLFLCGHRKTGTTLLLSLFDNHPELAVYPPDSGFFYLYYPQYDSDEYSKEEKIERMSDRILGMLSQDIEAMPEDQKSKLHFPLDEFKASFRTLAGKTDCAPKDMLECLLLAFKQTWEPSKPVKGWIEKTTSSEIYASDILEWFPSAKFIHVVRDPRDNWASLRSGWNERYTQFNDSLERLMQSMIDRGQTGMEFARSNPALYGEDRYMVIRFEDLVSNSRAVISSMAKFAGIGHEDHLYQPTFCGIPWLGNNFDGKKFSGISSSNVGRWRERVPEKETALIEFHYRDLMEYFGYRSEIDSRTACRAATEHYKWHNFAQLYP